MASRRKCCRCGKTTIKSGCSSCGHLACIRCEYLGRGSEDRKSPRPIWVVHVDGDDASMEGAYRTEERAKGEAATLAESLCDAAGLPRSAIDADEDGLTVNVGEELCVMVTCVNLYEEEA